jgi:peptidoglycan/xylan/chitin deacetylase (PgdA/CDA1 family)
MFSHFQKRMPILAYHALVSNNQTRLPTGWSRRHTVRLDSFRRQLDFVQSEGWTTIVPEGIEALNIDSTSKYCILTFDDGHRSDLIAAAALRSRGHLGIFYIPWGNVGIEGFLGPSDIRTLTQEKFAIGSHGLTHSPLTDRPDKGLREELVESRERLEDLMGRSVEDLAVPFGRYNRHVISAAQAAGYRRIMTSDIGVARIGGSIVFPRLPVTAETTLADFRRLISAGPTRAALRRLSSAVHDRLQSVRSAA